MNHYNVINYKRSHDELLEFFIYCISVPGKKADMVGHKLDKLFACKNNSTHEFIKYLINSNELENCLRYIKLGQYQRITRIINHIINNNINLNLITFDELINIKGIGKKTAHFFLSYSRENYNEVILDTHILKYLNHHNITNYKTTPSKEKDYQYLAEQFKKLHKEQNPDISLTKFDFQIWQYYQNL